MKSKFIDYQELEFMIASNSSERKASASKLNLRQIWKGFVEFILRSDEPVINTLKSQSGETYWTIYDRFTGRKAYFTSETEVRAWLDRRYSDPNRF